MNRLNIEFKVINPLNHNVSMLSPIAQLNISINNRVQMIKQGVQAVDYTKGKALSINRN